MSRMLVIWLFLSLSFSACSGRKRIPANILSPQKMETIMSDILLAEGYAESYLYSDSSRTRLSWMNEEADKVLAIHKVSQKTFRESYAFYKSRPDIFKVVIDTINNRSLRNRENIYDRTKRDKIE
jgi:Domain of unknown function (DUF4296)